MKTKKIVSIKTGKKKTVHDLEIKDGHHYILGDGTITHNSIGGYFPQQIISGGGGALFNSSVILQLSKAQLKDGDKEGDAAGIAKTGIIVTSKPVKNRFARPIPIKFHISFFKGMNPYVGLENYVTWEACGIQKGTFTEVINEIPQFMEDGVTPRMYRGKQKIVKENTGVFEFEADDGAKTWAVKHLNATVKGSELFTSKVFTEEVLKDLNENVIKGIFNLPKHVEHDDDLNAALGIIDDDIDNDEIDDNETVEIEVDEDNED